MSQPLIYANEGYYYDLIYKWKDYKGEVEELRKLITKFKANEGTILLDVGCGTGEHIKYLSGEFDCTGIDINSSLLKIAANKVKKAVFKQESMVDFKLSKKFDVIICLFSSIGYTKTLENLEKTLKNFSEHLNKGGVVIIEPWFTKQSKSFKVDVPFMTVYEDDKTKVARISIAKIEGSLSIMDTHYLVGEAKSGIRHFSDKHILGLFDKENFLDAMKKFGLTPLFLEKGFMHEDRGLYIGTKD